MMEAGAVEGKPAGYPRGVGGARMHGADLPFRKLLVVHLQPPGSARTAGGRVPAEDECKRLQF